MDEMNNNNGVETPAAPINNTAPESAPAPQANDFAYNDDPNQSNGTYYSYQPNMQGGSASVNEEPSQDDSLAKSTAKSSMIFGIIAAASVQLCLCFPVSIILGIIAMVKAFKAKKMAGRMPGMAIPGLICGIYGIALGAFLILYFAIFGLAFLFAFLEGNYEGDIVLGLQNLLSSMR